MGTVTIGTQTIEVYGDLAGANLYFDADPRGATWAAFAQATRNRLLVQAARLLNTFEAGQSRSWSGAKTVATQVNSWPRDNAACGSTTVTAGTTPTQVEEAAYELSLALGQSSSAYTQATTGNLLKRAKAGKAEVEFFGASISNGQLSTPLPAAVWRLVSCYMAAPTTSGTSGLPSVSGINCESNFPHQPSGSFSGGYS